jgi:hypothetical protein
VGLNGGGSGNFNVGSDEIQLAIDECREADKADDIELLDGVGNWDNSIILFNVSVCLPE